MIRSEKILQLALLQNQGSSDPSKNSKSNVLSKDQEDRQNIASNKIHTDNNNDSTSQSVPILFHIKEQINSDKLDICNLPIIVVDEQGNSKELLNNCINDEKDPHHVVFNTIIPKVSQNNSQIDEEYLEESRDNMDILQNSCFGVEIGCQLEVCNTIINPHLEQEKSAEAKEDNDDIEISQHLSSEDELIKSDKKRNRITDSWSTTEERKKREKGKAYLGRKKEDDGNWKYDVKRNKRQMKVRCNCKLSRNNKGLRCNTINEDQRKQIFIEFWSMSWKEKRVYIQMLCNLKQTQRARDRKETDKSRRFVSIEYYFKVGKDRINVCKTMFLNTLCVGEWSVRNWIKKSRYQGENICERSSKDENKAVPISQKRCQREIENLQEFFDQIPKMESHYCRASTRKLYLEPLWKSKSDMYEFYKIDWCSKKHINYVSKTSFKQLFRKNNFKLFRPKKDACDICTGFKTKNIDEVTYNAHIEKKEEARTEKQKDKASSSRTFTMDLQAVLLAPKLNVSAMYYKTKLAVHNMTFFDLQSKDGTCYLWNEVEGNLTADDFSSIIVGHLESIKKSLKESEKEIILFSDGCNYQNRNSTLANALLNFSVVNNLVVTQKYLERGHTQMEVDAMHSTIERKLKCVNINVPADYINICKSARRLPKPYEVLYLSHDYFKKFSCLKFVTSIRPGKRIGDPTVTDLRALKYNPNGTIQYKLRFPDAWEDLPLRINKIPFVPFTELPALYKDRLPVKSEKYNHLQILKNTLEKDYHTFYDNLPHT